MRPVSLIILVIAIVLASSCQREFDFTPGPDPADTLPDDSADALSPDNGGLLKRQIWKTGQFSDSVFINYVYDEEDRLIEYNQHFASFTQPKEEDYTFLLRFFYGDNGMVNKITTVYRTTEARDIAYSISEVKIFHDGGTGRYTYAIGSYVFEFEGSKKDSIVYVYDNNGRINQAKSFDINTGSIQNRIYTYDGNDNITRVQHFFDNGITNTLRYDLHYQYDDKMNPEVFGAIGLLMPGDGISFSVGKNNYISMKDELNRLGAPKRSFIYNTHNKPAETDLVYDDDPGEKGTLQYLYVR
ncbi:MAG: hypothetical protein KIT80_16675 [Chitinophagaceae bacterium]|nr:hypothetical protein [Chitinophagaceae bacterium]MCW5928554.1 hypothetical protein [Chitinophagaceae bacterium]